MAKEHPMDDKHPEMQTLSGYFALSEGGMVPSQKMKRQEAEREEALAELKEHRKKAMETLSGLGVIVCDPNPAFHRSTHRRTTRPRLCSGRGPPSGAGRRDEGHGVLLSRTSRAP